MVDVNIFPRNKKHFIDLIKFGAEVVGVCRELGIEPVASASLAVFAYTKNPNMVVNDIDVSCSESDFPKLSEALQARGIEWTLTEWHVLQAIRGDLKVEFDSKEFWMQDLSEDDEVLQIGDLRVKIVALDALKELYRRGLEATASMGDDATIVKHEAYEEKYEELAKC
jgi:hypothetical protein